MPPEAHTGHLVRTGHEVSSAWLAPETLKPKAAQLLLPARITAPSPSDNVAKP